MGSVPGEPGERGFNVGAPIDDETKDRALMALRGVESGFREIGLQITADTITDVMADLEVAETKALNFQWLMDQVMTIEKLAEKELKGKGFFYIPAERTRFFPTAKQPHIFGNAVATAFPSAGDDIAEAGTCLGLARGTACVTHLMRVLEIGLTALGNIFGVSLAHTNWAPAIEQIESKIREMHKDPEWKVRPDCKEQQEFYAQAASHFGILKDAWRNYTMHARGLYTEERAERIFENVKAFMQQLSSRLHE